ncbi:MAG: hypothetical protein M3R36_12830 [Bacteroidota bacterium]|nr:hypothetical protein [Bacteroidota bacterium]
MSARLKIDKEFLCYVIVFIWPFIYCFKFILSDQSYSMTIGNDFYILYNYKVILLDKLSNFNLPLWSPSEGCGYPFYSNPFTQTFYPLNAVLTVFYKINDGYSFADHQKFTVSGLSIFALGLLLWLRSLKIKLGYAVLAVCIVSVSSRLTEILRFTTAVHTIAWVPFILYGCTLALNNRKNIKAGLIVFASVIMMITAGYSYYVYYSIFLFLPYLLFLIFVKHKKYCFTEYDFNIRKYFVTLLISFTGAFAVCYPYLKGVKQLMDQTDSRVGDNFVFSTLHKFTFTDTIGSLFYPPASHIEGWYYFGMISILLVLCMYIYIIINRTQYKRQLIFLSIIAVWFITVSYISYGEYSYLFKFFWLYFPGFSRLRIFGRMNIIFLPVFAYLLAVAYGLFLHILIGGKNENVKKSLHYKYFILSFILAYAIILFTQFYFFNNKVFGNYFISYSKGFFQDFDENVFIRNSILSFLVLIIFLFTARYFNKKKLVLIFFLITFSVNVMDLYQAGSRQWAIMKKPDTSRKKLMVDERDINSLSIPRNSADGMISLSPNYSVGYVPEWYYGRYINFLQTYAGELDESSFERFNELMGLNDGRRIFCSQDTNYQSISDFVNDSRNYESTELINLKIDKYNGDELICIVETKDDGFCSFIDNWDSNWTATVNGKEASIGKLFGTFKSVRIEKGINIVMFKYSPKIF